MTTPTTTGHANPAGRDRAVILARTNAYPLGLLGLAVAIATVFTLINPGVYASGLNVQSIAFSVPEIGLMALAISVAMTVAGIDLSTVAVANLSALFVAWYSRVGEAQGQNSLVTTLIALAGALAVGALCGAINGLVISRLNVAPILTTLATMQVYMGAALALTRGEASYGVTAQLSDFGFQSVAGLPLIFWAFVLITAAVWFVMTKTSFGLRATMLGANRTAAEYSGITYTNVVMRTYMLTGVISALAGIVMVSRTASASAGYGSSYLLLAITIAVLGGANPFGGRIAIAGAALAALVLQLIASGLNMLSISPYVYQIVQGLILASVFIVAFERKRLSDKWSARRDQQSEESTPVPTFKNSEESP